MSCTRIGGTLVIMPDASVTNLNGLRQIQSVEEDLIIFAPNLTSLSGLEGLTNIGGSLQIHNALILESLTGLNNLVTIGSNLNIITSPELRSLEGLESLERLEARGNINSIIYISQARQLNSLSGLANLTNTDDSLEVRVANTNVSETTLNEFCQRVIRASCRPESN